MRQTNVIRLCRDRMKLMLCVMLLVFSCIGATLHADVSNVAVDTSFSGSSNRINSAGYVNLNVTWQGDSPTYTAKYKVNGAIVSSEGAINNNSTTAKIAASVIGDTGGSAVTIQVQIVDSAGKSAEASSQGVIVDTKAPTLTATITNGPTFSQNSSVRIQITSDKEVNAPTVTCNGTNATMEGSISVGTSFVYNLQLSSSFSNGSYNISISATDTTEPSTNANRGSTTVGFNVGTSATGSTSIDGVNPGSPTNAASVTLTGTSPSGVAKVSLMDGSSEVTSINTSSTDWTMTIAPAEGNHSYVAVSYDSLGQEISKSSAFAFIVDRTAPSAPTVSQEGIPAQTNATSQTFSVTVEGYSTEVSSPVYLQAYNNNSPVGTKYNVTTSGSPVNAIVPLSEGSNSIYFQTEDAAGNKSTNSETISIQKSGSSSANVATAIVDTYSVPAPTTSMMGAGSHSLTVNFNQAVGDAIPTVTINCGGGGSLSVNGSWSSNTQFTGNFTVPSNGGASFDGAATIVVTGAKDTYGNLIPDYTQTGAFSIDSTAPISTITGDPNIYVSANGQSVTLNGTVNDGEGSGIDYMTLVVTDATGAETKTNVPLQTGAQSPWTYNYNASSLAAGEYTLVTSAVDKAIPQGNVENYGGKASVKIIVDTTAPVVSRVSINNTGIDIPEGMVIASDVTRIVAVATEDGSGLDFGNANFVLTLTGPTGTAITGEKTNNGNDTMYFDFPTLTEAGDYTVTFTPVDKAGNAATSVTKKFTINKSAPDSAEFNPASYAVANQTEENLASSSVKVTLSSSAGITPSYNTSTISVRYNGNEVGSKQFSEEALIAKLHDGNMKADGSHDGSYYVTVVPHSSTGITGAAITSSFIYDTQSPVVTESSPSIAETETWFGTNTSQFSLTVSDAPKDILEHYNGQYPEGTTPAQPGDTSWYNSNGSGVNFDVSSFSWTMGDQTSTPSYRNGSKMIVTAPTAPASAGESDPGVADVAVSIILADNVTQGTTVPNTTTLSRTYKYDYLAPKISITTANGAKYCKNLLKVKATAEDQGTDENLQVTKIEYSEDGVNWNPLTVNGLPAKSADFTLELDITNKAETTHSIQFRAVDRAGNTSSAKSFSYTIDRTGPSAPELTIPLADYTVNKRSQTFKWAASNGATVYLFQVSDDSSFNNVLNLTTNTEYPSLKGTITSTTDGSFGLPKDGNFYWRVAAIEKCEDGFNVSDWSITRKVVVDSVKPYILAVSPSPSSSNTVSTGMVTFTIRFSETLDATTDLTATLTSAGGQVMKIEKISCTGDTWTGTTVIPKNNSALYDGTAIISVQGAKDLAGNAMAIDTTHTIVVNTGPSFTTKLFSNPANEYEITILTRASESLQTAPSVYVKQNSVKTPVTMNFLKDRFYSGSYKIDKENPGSAYITLSGTDLYGMVGNSTVEFTIADVNASSRLSVTSASGRATLKAAENSTANPTSIFIIDKEVLESPFTADESISSSVRASAGIRAAKTSKEKSELVGVLGLDLIGPSNTKLKKCMLYTADVNGEVITANPDKVSLYRQNANGEWVYQGGKLKDYKISAQLSGLGRLALMADETAPRVSSITPENLEKLDTNKPEIKGQFVDNGSGLDADSLKLYIDGLQVQDVNLEKGGFSYQVKKSLKAGKHEIVCEISDRVGNVCRKAIDFTAPVELNIGEFQAYPSPARGNHIFFGYNFGAVPESVSLKIYDTAGHIVAKFGKDEFDRRTGKVLWDLTNQKGKRIANGTYIYRLEVTANGQKQKKKGKFAVLK